MTSLCAWQVLPATVLLLGFAPVSGQQVPPRRLAGPEAVSRDGFTRIVAIRELSDERVLVVDELDRLIHVLDAGLGSARQVGRQGSGPGEYQAPGTLFPLAGDSFAIRDMRNARMLVFTGRGEIAGFLDRFGAPPGTPEPDLRLPPTASDGRGCFYAQAAPGEVSRAGGRVRLAAAGPLLRWCGGRAGRDTVALVPVPAAEQTGSAAGGMVIRRPAGPFSTRAQWAVGPDGSIAIVTPDPYRVEIVRPDGTRRRGPVVAHDPLRLTEAHKAEWRKEASAPRVVVVGGRDGRRGVQVVSPEVEEPAEWPRHLPPFLYDAVRYAPDGRVWVRRTTAAGADGLYDVFDPSGSLVERVSVPRGSRVLGFGRGTLYLVTRDEVDLEYVARHRFP